MPVSGAQGTQSSAAQKAAIDQASQTLTQQSVQESQDATKIQGDSIAGRTVQSGTNIAEALGKGAESQTAQA